MIFVENIVSRNYYWKFQICMNEKNAVENIIFVSKYLRLYCGTCSMNMYSQLHAQQILPIISILGHDIRNEVQCVLIVSFHESS